MPSPTELIFVVRADLPATRAAHAAAVLGLGMAGRLPAGPHPHRVSTLCAGSEQLRDLHAKARAREDLVTLALDDCLAVAVSGPRHRVTALTERCLPARPLPDAQPLPAAEAGRRRAEMFPARDDRRFHGPATGDERRMLADMLRDQRSTLELKCSGLDTGLARRSVEPSTLSLLGLVRHLADVERRWFRRVLAGQDVPPLFSPDAAPDAAFDGAVPDPDVVTAAWAAWRGEVAFADAFAASAPDLDVEGHDGWRGTVSLRWVLIHMIEEYARHNGHADLLRECIDGAIGV